MSGGWGIAMCKHCDNEPLVSTFAFSGAEFFCLGCGRTYGFLDPRSEPETPALLAKMEQRKEEWLAIGRDLLSGGAMLRDCELCCGNEPHLAHASDEEKERHTAASAKIDAIRARGVLV